MSHKHHVVALSVDRVGPDSGVRERGKKGREFAPDGTDVALIEWDVESKHASGIQMLLYALEVFLGVDGSRAFGENVERVAGDDVELVVGRHQVMARIVEDHAGLRVFVDAIVLLAEEAR